MRRNTGATFRETRPETIITSACRGEARKTSEPNLARSFLELVAFIISIAQHASPKVAGHRDDFRAQLIRESSRVVKTSGRASAMMLSSPINLLPTLRARVWRAFRSLRAAALLPRLHDAHPQSNPARLS